MVEGKLQIEGKVIHVTAMQCYGSQRGKNVNLFEVVFMQFFI